MSEVGYCIAMREFASCFEGLPTSGITELGLAYVGSGSSVACHQCTKMRGTSDLQV